MKHHPLATVVLAVASSAPLFAQSHSTPIARRPHSVEIAAVNADQDSISVVHSKDAAVVDLDPGPGVSRAVGADPRTLAFTPSGGKLYVVDHRGEGGAFPNGVFGSVHVLDATAGYAVTKVIAAGVGVEPFGIAMAPDGGFAAVTGFQSGTVAFIDTATDTVSFTFHYLCDAHVPAVTQPQVDPDLDGIADHGKPRGIAIDASGTAAWVTHFLSGHVTKLALVRASPTGKVVGATLAKDIDLNRFAAPVDALGNPVFVTANASQGLSRNLESIAIEPSGKRAWVPHVLANFLVKVETTRFSVDNQAYPAVSIIDLQSETFEFGLPGQTDRSDRIEFDPALPLGQNRSHGVGTVGTGGATPTLDLNSDATPGARVAAYLSAGRGGALAWLLAGAGTADVKFLGGHLLVANVATVLPILLDGAPGIGGAGTFRAIANLPDEPLLVGAKVAVQAVVADPEGFAGVALSNAGVLEIGPAGPAIPPATFARRVAQPVQVEFTPDGGTAFVVDYASEDVAVFTNPPASSPQCKLVYPPLGFNRVPFATDQPIGENPNGLAMIPAPDQQFNLFVHSSVSHDLSFLEFDRVAGTIAQIEPRLALIAADTFSAEERAGKELFSDATRTQTASNQNGSCSECHFDGGVDGLTWQFAEGPRQTIALAGGPLQFGLLFWKSKATTMKTFEGGFRIHQGGNGQLSPKDVAGLTAWANQRLPLPLNPHAAQPMTDSEKRGRDLFFGTDDFGQNPTLRSANCAECHPDGLFTIDVIAFPADLCKSLEPGFANLQNVNSQDEDGILSDDADMTFTEDCLTAGGAPKTFFRGKSDFGVPTKRSVFATAPYFHNGQALSLRAVIDPAAQTVGPNLDSHKNTAHDLRGFVVNFTLQTSPTQQDVEDVLAFISRL